LKTLSVFANTAYCLFCHIKSPKSIKSAESSTDPPAAPVSTSRYSEGPLFRRSGISG